MKTFKRIAQVNGLLMTLLLFCSAKLVAQKQVSLWLFDEMKGSYPSSVMENSSPNDYPLVLGLGGKIVAGKFGNALEVSDEIPLKTPAGNPQFGLSAPPAEAGRKHDPLIWNTANFGALMTSGEKHLRNEIGFVNVTDTKLNLGNFDWTIEFWLQLLPSGNDDRYIFEIGEGPLMEEGKVTALYIDKASGDFVLHNDPSNTNIHIKSAGVNKLSSWHHLAFVYNSAAKTLTHFVDGKQTSIVKNISLTALTKSPEAYMSVGRDGNWKNRLNGRIDELKFSEGKIYESKFKVPESNSLVYGKNYHPVELQKGLPLLFDSIRSNVLDLGNRKHLFIDSAFLQKNEGLKFVVNPPVKMERVIDNIKGQFRKHLTVVEDESGTIRIYNGGVDDYLAVYTSKDGVNFEAPDLHNGVYKGAKNIVLPSINGGMGNPFIDPNGPAEERWKYLSDYHRRGVYMYTSPDGYTWTRKKMSAFPFRTGSQSSTFYDDQRQTYVSYHRTDLYAWPKAGGTLRRSVLSQFTDINKPVEFAPVTAADYQRVSATTPIKDPLPWFLDNGPLTPGGFGMEFPIAFSPDAQDPDATDIYVAKAQKYPWAPDTYIAFPTIYFHYEEVLDKNREILGEKQFNRGSGPLETQLSVSRNGLQWKRYPRPAYIGIGKYLGRDIKTAYIAIGMVKRGDEIWQYYFGETQYHSSYEKTDNGRGVYRLVQRLDGFVSLDSPYDTVAQMTTRPFTFKGNVLELNIDTDAAGYAQVGFLDETGKPIKGFGIDDCIYVNGDFINTQVQWMEKGKDISALQGKTVQLVIKMRGSKLYALQFTDNLNKNK